MRTELGPSEMSQVCLGGGGRGRGKSGDEGKATLKT